MAKYEGVVANMDWQVFKDGVLLSPQRSLQVQSHSPDGFSWGYGGSGPHQLALALLLEEGLDPFSWGNAGSGAHQLAMTLLVEEGLSTEEARSLHHTFCLTFLAMLDSTKDWELTSKQCQDIITIVRISNRNMGFSNRA